MSNVFITGITGMVGSHLADYLLENTDWEIFGFLRWDDDLKNLRHLSNRINQAQAKRGIAPEISNKSKTQEHT